MATHPSSGARKCCSPPRSPPHSSPSSPLRPGEGHVLLTPPPPRLLQYESPCARGVSELVILQDLVGEGEEEGGETGESDGEGGQEGEECPLGDARCPPAREAAGGVAGPALPHRPALPCASCGVSSTTGQQPRLSGVDDVQPDSGVAQCLGEGEVRSDEDSVTASPPRGRPAPPPLGKATVLCEVAGGDMQGPEWSDLVCWQCGKECQVPQRAGTSGGRSGSLCHGLVGEAHAVRCPGEVVGSLQVLVGEALWQYPVLGPAEQGHHHADEEWALVLSGRGWRAAINSCGGGGELVTMSSDNMACGAAPSPATRRPELPSSSGRCSSIYGFKISGGDSSKVRNLLPMFASSRNTAREAASGVTFRVKGDASWQTQQPNRNSDKCDIRMYRGEEGGAEDSDDSRLIKLCGVNLGSCPASPDPYPLFRCNTLPRRLPSYRLSPLPPWPQVSAASPDSEIAASDTTSRRLSLVEADEGLVARPVPSGGDVGGGRGCGTTLPRPPPPYESSSTTASHSRGPSTPTPPWGTTGSAPPDTTPSCYVNSIPRPYRGSASSSASTSPVPPAVPQLHRPRDFLPTPAGHNELPQGEPVSPLSEDLDDCFPYEMQPPAPLLTTRRPAAKRAAAGHVGAVGSTGETASARSAVVGIQMTSADTKSHDTDSTVTSGVNFASVGENKACAVPGTTIEGMIGSASPALTHTSWPLRGPSVQGRPWQESAPPVVTVPNTNLLHTDHRDPVKVAVVGVETCIAVTQDSEPSPSRTLDSQNYQHHPIESLVAAVATQHLPGALGHTKLGLPEEEIAPPVSKEATPQPSPLFPALEEEATPPSSKEATPQPSSPLVLEEEEDEEATPQPSPPPPVLEEEATDSSSEEAAPQASPPSFVMEEEATVQSSTPPVQEEVIAPVSKEVTPQSSPSPHIPEEEVTSLASFSSPAAKDATTQPSTPSPPHLSEEATSCHSPAADKIASLPSSPCPPEKVMSPSHAKQATPPPTPPSSSPPEEATPITRPPHSPSKEAILFSPPQSEEVALSLSQTQEVTTPPSLSLNPSKQPTPPPSPPGVPKNVTPPPSLSCIASEEATPCASSPSIAPKDVTLPPAITTKEATPPPTSSEEVVEPGIVRNESTPARSGVGEVRETVAAGPMVRGVEGVQRSGVSQRAALLTRHQQADGPARPRSTRFPLDIICGSKVSGETSPVACTRHRLSSLGQVLPPPTHNSTRSKSASRVGSGGTDPKPGVPRRDSDVGPQGGTGQGLGQAEEAAAPRPVVLPLDATLKNRIRQTIDSFTGLEATSAPVSAPALSSSPLAALQDEMTVQDKKEPETVQQASPSTVPDNGALAGENPQSPAGGDSSGVQIGALLEASSECPSEENTILIEDVDGAERAVTHVTRACSEDLHRTSTQRAMDTTEPRDETTILLVGGDALESPSKPAIVDALAATCNSLLEEPQASMSNHPPRGSSQSPSRIRELEAQLLFIDEGPPATREALEPRHSSTDSECHGSEGLTSPLEGQREGQHTEAVTCQSPTKRSSDEGVKQDVASSGGTFAAVRVVVTEVQDSSSEGEGRVGNLTREESMEEYEPALEVVSLDPGHASSHSSISVATVVTLNSRSQSPEHNHPDEDAEEEFVDATDGSEGSRETAPDQKSVISIEPSQVEALRSSSPVNGSLRVECEAPEDGSVSSGGHGTDPDLPASASASSTGSETWWTSNGGPVARRDLFPLDEDNTQWRTALGAVHRDSDEEPAGYESDEDFAAMDADMQRLEEKLKKFEIELGGKDGNVVPEDDEDKGDSMTSPARSSQDNESLRVIAIPEMFPSRRTTQTKHLSLMTTLEVHQYEDSASESENESQAASSSDSADFLFVKTKVKVKPGQRISRSLDHRRPKNHHVLGKSFEGDTKSRKEATCLFEERVDLSSLVLPVEVTGEQSVGELHTEDVCSDKLDDDVSIAQTRGETVRCEEVCESVPEEIYDVVWGDEDHLLLGYIWHEDDMAAVDFEGLEEFQSFEGQEALLFMFEDDDEDEVVSEEESEGEPLLDEDDFSPAEYLADESECEGDSRSRTLPATKGSDNTFVAAFKSGLRKASKYFGPKSDVRLKKVSGGGRECLQDTSSPAPPGSAGLDDDTKGGVYNVQSGRLAAPTSHHAPLSDSEGPDIYSCSSGEYYAVPAMCVNTSDEDPSLALTRASTSHTEAPIQPPVPPRRWANRKSRTPQEADVSSRGRGESVRQAFAAAPLAPLPAGSTAHACVQRTDDHTNGSKDTPPSLAGAPHQMRGPLASPVWEGFCPPAAPFPGPHLLPQPCVPPVPWSVDPYSRVPEAAHPQHAIANHRLAHAAPSHPCAAPEAILPHPCAAHHAALSHPCAGHHATPLAPHPDTLAATHSHKPTSVKQLKRKQQEKILRQEAEEGLEAAGCAFCVGMPQSRPQPPQHTVHWRQSSPHPRASSDRRSWPPRVSCLVTLRRWSLPSLACTNGAPLTTGRSAPTPAAAPQTLTPVTPSNLLPVCLVSASAALLPHTSHSGDSVASEGWGRHSPLDTHSTTPGITSSPGSDSDPYWTPVTRLPVAPTPGVPPSPLPACSPPPPPLLAAGPWTTPAHTQHTPIDLDPWMLTPSHSQDQPPPLTREPWKPTGEVPQQEQGAPYHLRPFITASSASASAVNWPACVGSLTPLLAVALACYSCPLLIFLSAPDLPAGHCLGSPNHSPFPNPAPWPDPSSASSVECCPVLKYSASESDLDSG